ncbi:MAG: hypothetical protein ACYDAJ_10950, partial [Nitrosotalea sp.]
SPQSQMPSGDTSAAPSLTVFNGNLLMAWKGMDNDQRMWYATSSGGLLMHTVLGKIGHNPAIDGYDVCDTSAPTIDIQDPWYGPSTQDFNSFPSTYNGGAAWGNTYFTN